jgi:hypothetical protein
MERRKLLKALITVPAITLGGGSKMGVAYPLNPDKKYVVFLNMDAVDIGEFCRPMENAIEALPAGTRVHAVRLASDQTMDDVCRIYEIEKGS